MPKLLLFLGCFLLSISVLMLNLPILSQFDLVSVQWMYQHRLNSFFEYNRNRTFSTRWHAFCIIFNHTLVFTLSMV